MRRTREAVSGALLRMIFSRRYDSIRTHEIIAASGIGRSTFYTHFRGKDDVLLAVIDPIFAPLAEAGAGRADPIRLEAILQHVWEQRSFARILFGSELMPRLERKLAQMIEARMTEGALLPEPAALAATGAAAAQLAMLRLWIGGGVSCSAATLAQQMIGCGRGGRAGMTDRIGA